MLTVLHCLMIKPSRLVYASILEDIRMNSYGIFDSYPAPTPSMLTSIYYVANKLHIFGNERGVQTILPLLYSLTKYFWITLIMLCSAERSFSCLIHVKSYLRSTMCQERLSTLALLEIEKDVMPNIEEIIHRKLWYRTSV